MSTSGQPGYGHEPLFGVVLTPDATDAERTVERAVLAEDVGLDIVSVSDHQYHPGFLDAWTLLAWIAARTRRVTVMPNVANLQLRAPAGLARAAASLDVLSAGRVELGIGAGGHGHAIVSEGGTDLTVGERMTAFSEAVAVLRRLTMPGSPATLDGAHHRLRGADPGPAHPHPIGLWIGAVGPRMLRLVGRLGDGWIPSATRIPPEHLDDANARIDRSARAAGRDPSEIRRLYNLPAPALASTGGWVRQLIHLGKRYGISGFLLFTDDVGTIDRYGTDIAPRVRDALR